MSIPILQDRMAKLAGLSIKSGAHKGGQDMCVMEAVAWVAGEPWSDHPECACPVITSFMVAWNDALPGDGDRDRLLKPLVPLLVGTRSVSAVEAVRSKMALDWFIGEYTPAWLELAGLKEEADALRAAPTLENCERARDKASAAWSAARSAAWSAARSAAESAAWSAAESAAWSALLATVTKLQESAIALVHRMIAVTEVKP